MTSDRSRRGPIAYADLLDGLEGIEGEDRACVAKLLGFHVRRTPPVSESPAVASKQAEGPELDELFEPPPVDPRSPVRFWRVVRTEYDFEFGEDPQVELAPADPAKALSVAGIGRDSTLDLEAFPAPVRTPITPWSQLRRQIETVYRVLEPIGELDVDAVVNELGRGAVLTRIPRRARRTQVPRVVVILDRSWRLLPFWEDAIELCQHLGDEFGRDKVRAEVWTEPPLWGDELASPSAVCAELREGDVLLVLGDLGLYEGEPDAGVASPVCRRWAALGRALAQVGVSAVALLPCPRSRWRPELVQYWRCIDWERPEVGGGHARSGAGQREVEALLALVSWTVCVEPDLLRELRLTLPGADLGTEADVWNHAQARRARWDLSLEPELRRRAEAELAQMLADPKQREVIEAAVERVRCRHRHRPREIWLEEVTKIESLAPGAGLVHGSERDAAASFWHGVRCTVELERGLGDEVDLGGWLRRSMTGGDARVNAAAWNHAVFGPELRRLVQLELTQRGGEGGQPHGFGAQTMLPDGVRREWTLTLHGDALRLEGEHEVGAPSLARVEGYSSWVDVGGESAENTADGWVLPEEAGELLIETTGQRLWLERVSRPSWAAQIGYDEHGLWALLEVGGAEQQMRWISPGRFLMGLPETEEGRWKDEGPEHPVTITHGFWMAETPCTQALWKVVMGDNPSKFRGPRRPVEQVSWGDVQRFLARLDARTERGFALPTEAQWEYACRAGTGALRDGQLDEVAWYQTNSGQETRDVGHKHENAWGLRDMLGNVNEWCSDWYSGSYEPESVDDPQGPPGGLSRVLRGGSWYSYAGIVRATYRNYQAPGDRSSYLGFRLVRGQEVRQSDARSESESGRGPVSVGKDGWR